MTVLFYFVFQLQGEIQEVRVEEVGNRKGNFKLSHFLFIFSVAIP